MRSLTHTRLRLHDWQRDTFYLNMADMNYVTRETGDFVAPLQLFTFLQDNIQLIIYSRTHPETIMKDRATMPHREQNTVPHCSQLSLFWDLQRTGEESWQNRAKVSYLTPLTQGSDFSWWLRWGLGRLGEFERKRNKQIIEKKRGTSGIWCW